MNVGEKLNIPFGGGTKEGTVVKVCEKSVWLRVDFPKHPGKLVRRKLSQLSSEKPSGAKKKRFWSRKG